MALRESSQPRLSVIVPHRDDLAGLDACLAALGRQSLAADDCEIIIADNGSRCGLEAVRQLVAGRGRIVSVATPGAGPARNGGVAAARGEILAFVDSDCLPRPDWLAAGLACLETAEGQVVCGAMEVLVPRGRRLDPAEAFELAFAFDNQAYVRRKGFGVTANLMVRRDDFLKVGGFRVGVSEDQDWCHRARHAGLQLVYAPAAIVGHPARRDWTALRSKWRRIMAEQYALALERPFGRLRWLLRSWLLPASILLHGVRVLTTRRLAGHRARIAALEGLVRLRAWRLLEAHRLLLQGDAKSPVDKPLI